MARLNIYVPDDLKARMDQVGDLVNWSEVARPAFQVAVAIQEIRMRFTEEDRMNEDELIHLRTENAALRAELVAALADVAALTAQLAELADKGTLQALRDANDRAEHAEAERDALRESLARLVTT